MTTIAQALELAEGLGLARLDAQLLLLHVLGKAAAGRAWLLAHDRDAVHNLDEYLALVRRREHGEPVAYLVGEKEFYGLRLKVDARVLVPRPDTEILVEWALELVGCAGAHHHPTQETANPRRVAVAEGHPTIIDLGTGSGAIALAIKQNCPQARVDAVDTSEDALAVARANAGALALDVAFRCDSWLTGAQRRYDLIVSNPPYIPAADEHLAALHHEPLDALASGPEGLDAIREIVAQAPAHLNPGGWLLLEHGWDQSGAVAQLLEAAGFAAVESRKDLAGIKRCTGGQWPERG